MARARHPDQEKTLLHHLAVLGLRAGASREEIRKAYRDLAKRWHPDRHPEGWERDQAQEEFRRINLAYEWLREHGSPRRPPRQRVRTAADGAAAGPRQEKERAEPTIADLLMQARAEITWGRHPEAVYLRLVAGGVSPGLARRVLWEFLDERRASFRRKGWRKMAGGIGVAALGLLAFISGWASPGLGLNPTRMDPPLLLAGMILFIFGVWRLATGHHWIRSGGRGWDSADPDH
jgi:molecular chaperone DnaJ